MEDHIIADYLVVDVVTHMHEGNVAAGEGVAFSAYCISE